MSASAPLGGYWAGTWLAALPCELGAMVLAFVRNPARAGRVIWLITPGPAPVCICGETPFRRLCVCGAMTVARDACPPQLLAKFDAAWHVLYANLLGHNEWLALDAIADSTVHATLSRDLRDLYHSKDSRWWSAPCSYWPRSDKSGYGSLPVLSWSPPFPLGLAWYHCADNDTKVRIDHWSYGRARTEAQRPSAIGVAVHVGVLMLLGPK